MVAGQEDVTLQGGVNRPIEMSQMHMYGVIGKQEVKWFGIIILRICDIHT